MTNMVVKSKHDAVFETLKTGVIHPYVMNHKTAKKKMIINAGKDPVTQGNVTNKSTKVELSTGAFREIVIPLLSYWSDLAQLKEKQEVSPLSVQG